MRPPERLSHSLFLLAAMSLVASGCGRDPVDLFGVGGPQGDGGGGDGPVLVDGGDGGGKDVGPKDTGDGGPPTKVVDLKIVGANDPLPVGATRMYQAIAVFLDGSMADVTGQASWMTTNPRVIAVQPGLVKGVSPGDAQLVVQFGGISRMITIHVTSGPVMLVSVSVQPSFVMLGVGQAVQLQAIANFSDGSTSNVTRSANWTSSDPSVVAAGPGGFVQAVGPGQATITADFNGVKGSAQVTVGGMGIVGLVIEPASGIVQIGGKFQFRALAQLSNGSTMDVSNMASWTALDPMLAAIDGTGLATGLSPGMDTITASFAGFGARAVLVITQATLVSLTISPNPLVLSQFASAPLRAIGTFSDGTMSDVTASAVWTSDNPMIAGVSNAPGMAGVVTGTSPGTANITATFMGVSGMAQVTVSTATLVSISIQPSPLMIPAGLNGHLTASGTFSDGSMRDITASVIWSSANPMIADVSNMPGSQGSVAARSVGQVTITATLMGVSASVQVIVTMSTNVVSVEVQPQNAQTTVGLRSDYTAIAVFSDGSMLDVTQQASWSTDDSNVATISNLSGAQGQLFAQGAGMTTVRATFMSVQGTATVTVMDSQLIQIQIQPIAPTLIMGQTIGFSVRAIFSNGTSRNVNPGQVQWTTSDPTIVGISPNGRATANAAGMAQISAMYMGLSDSTPVTVTAGMLIELQVTPIDASTPVGQAIQYQAVAIFSDGSSRNVTFLATWQSSDQSIAQISTGGRGGPPGRAVGIAPGTAQITATFMGFQGMTNLTVTAAIITSISVSPAALTIPVGAQQQYQASAIFSDGTSQNITGMATWLTQDQSVAQITNGRGGRGGLVAIGPGMTTVQAIYMGVTGMATVTVSGATLTQIQVSPFDRSVAAGESVQYQAVAIYSDGSSMMVTGMATWQSSNDMVAQVSNAGGSRGLATTLAPGMTTVSATFMGMMGSTSLTVTSATIQQIQVTPFDSRIPAGFSERLTATAIYTDGTTQNITQLATWQSSDAAVAPVTTGGARGNVSALSPGTVTISVTYQGSMGSTSFTVTSATLSSIAVAPNPAATPAGASVQLTATGNFSDGSMLDLTNDVTWTSNNPMIADVSNAAGSRGLASGFMPGTVTITAARSMVTGSTTLSVR